VIACGAVTRSRSAERRTERADAQRARVTAAQCCDGVITITSIAETTTARTGGRVLWCSARATCACSLRSDGSETDGGSTSVARLPVAVPVFAHLAR
jgi:hypothetical protein